MSDAPQGHKPAESGLRVGTFAGAPILIEPAFLLFAAYIVGSDILRNGLAAAPGAFLFLAVLVIAVVIHEIGHAAMAAALKIPSKRIVLTFFGGYVEFAFPPRKRWHEIAVSAAGPGANIATWALCIWLLSTYEPPPAWLMVDPPGWLGPVNQLAWISLILGLFNLLPGFPLDGGHIMRAFLNYFVPRDRAGNIAGWFGLLLAGLFGVYALSNGWFWSAAISGFLGLAAWGEIQRTRAPSR